MNEIRLLKDILNDNEGTPLFDIFINIYLVIMGVREVCLIETGDMDVKEQDLFWEIVGGLNESLEIPLTIKLEHEDHFPRYFIFLSSNDELNDILDDDLDEEQIGRILGYQCAGNEYHRYDRPRFVIRYVEEITNMAFYTEVCDLSVFSKDEIISNTINRINIINDALNQIGYSAKLVFDQDDGVNYRYQKLVERDVNYISENMNKYIDDFENFYISNKEILMTSKTYKHLIKLECLNLIAKLYDDYVLNHKDDHFYDGASTLEEIANAAQKLKNKDTKFWKKHFKSCE